MSIRQTQKFRLRKLITLSLVAMGLHATAAHAEETDTPMFLFGGFGTLGMVHSSEDKANFKSSVLVPTGAGYSHAWSADVESRIGAQVTANFSPQISAVVQVISEQRYDNSYMPGVEWANLKYQFTPDFSIRVGRIVQPDFLVSDYRKLGYSNVWVRPPIEVYSLMPVNSSDGVDTSYRVHAGEFTNTLQANYGNTDVKLANGGGVAQAKDEWAIYDTVEYGHTTLHVNYHQTNLTVAAYKPLFDGFRQFGPEGIAIADKYDVTNKRYRFIGLGASYDPGNWFVMGEWGSTNIEAVIGKRSAWYASGGYRLGKFTPYLTYAQTKADSNTSDPGLNVSTLPANMAVAAASLNVGLNTLLGTIPVQKTISVGTRWDFMKNTDLKLQFDHIRIGAGSSGVLTDIQPGFQTGGTVNVFSTTIDFVF
jgi:hypothetical protein